MPRLPPILRGGYFLGSSILYLLTKQEIMTATTASSPARASHHAHEIAQQAADRFDAVVGSSRGSGGSLLNDESPSSLAVDELTAIVATMSKDYAQVAQTLATYKDSEAPLIIELRETVIEHLADRTFTALRPELQAFATAANLTDSYPEVLEIGKVLHLWVHGKRYPSMDAARYILRDDFLVLHCGTEVPMSHPQMREAEAGAWRTQPLNRCRACDLRSRSWKYDPGDFTHDWTLDPADFTRDEMRDKGEAPKLPAALSRSVYRACRPVILDIPDERDWADDCWRRSVDAVAAILARECGLTENGPESVQRREGDHRRRLTYVLGPERYASLCERILRDHETTRGMFTNKHDDMWQRLILAELQGNDPGGVGGDLGDRLANRIERRLERRSLP